ncbi:MAG: hypothetical protein LBE91_09245 [Tannerella sp.]|jgi:hypothetical protein|nr:hypothetical protein [Tannerella sp.]
MNDNITYIAKNDGRESPLGACAERSRSGDLGVLLEKYFNGETSASEELQLRQYFRSQDVADDLKPYKTLFAYIDEEKKLRETPASKINSKKSFSIKQKILYFAAAAAACVVMLLSINLFNRYYQSTAVSTGSFVVIDGRYYTDAQLVRSMALEALMNVAVPIEEYSPVRHFVEQSNVMHEQLREISNIFTE